MNPALMAYMQAVQKQAQSANSNPPNIEQGVGDAMRYGQALGNAIQVTPQQSNSHLLQALAAMANGSMQPHSGPPRSKLERFNLGLQHYNQARQALHNQSRNQNYALWQTGHHLNSNALKERRGLEREHKNDLLKMAMLESSENHHRDRMGLERERMGRLSLSDLKAQKELASLQGIENLKEQGYIPINSLEPSARADFQKDVRKKVSEISTNKRSINILSHMEKIFEKYPDIGTDYTHALNTDEEGWFSSMRKKVADPKRLAAIQQLKKYSADLNLAVIQGMPSKMGTDLLKRTIAAASPNGHLTSEAFFEIANTQKERAHENIKQAHLYQKALKMGVMPLAEEMEELQEQEPDNGRANDSAENPYDQYSAEDLRTMINQAEQRGG